MKRFTIQDLIEGKCTIINNGTRKELNKVLRLANPNCIKAGGSSKYYEINFYNGLGWRVVNNDLPKQSVKDFLEPEFKKGDIVLVSDDNRNWVRAILYIIDNDSTHKYVTKSRSLQYSYVGWKFIKLLEEEIIELTLQDISDGKGVGIPSHLIRIKEK